MDDLMYIQYLLETSGLPSMMYQKQMNNLYFNVKKAERLNKHQQKNIDKLIDILIGGGTLGDTCLKKCPFKQETTEDFELSCFGECKSKDRWKEWLNNNAKTEI